MHASPIAAPRVAVIVPGYKSTATISASLSSFMAQDYPNLEIIVVDSSPDLETTALVRQKFPSVRIEHSPRRLLPHAARNRGVELTEAEWLLFTDPDIIAPPEWISAMLNLQRTQGGVIVSAIACFRPTWTTQGIHFCKYNHWLPGRSQVARLEVGPTSGMLCRRADFERVGGFAGDYMLGDTLISYAFAAAGIPLWLMPAPAAQHWHTGTWRQFLRERRERAREFGIIRLTTGHWRRRRLWLMILATLLPLRFGSFVRRGVRDFAAAGQVGTFLRVSPVVLSGYVAWLLGELGAYYRAACGRTPGGPCRY